MAHTGTYEEGFEGDRNLYFTVGDTRFALIACTFATNYGINHENLEGKRSRCINMIHPITGGGRIYRPLPSAFADTLQYVEADYHEARKNADIVLFYPHSGGQFNVEPGAYTKQLVKMSAELGFDGVFAGHAHTTQLAEYVNGKPCFYSLGNVSMSPGTFYSIPECLPEYDLAVHLYVEEKKVQKVTFSIFKMIQEDGVPMRIVPVDALYKQLGIEDQNKLTQEVAVIYSRVTGQPDITVAIQKEYQLPAK